MNKLKEIPIFFTVDDKYAPFLGVAMQSLVDNASDENMYIINIMTTAMNEENRAKINKYERENVKIVYHDVTDLANNIKDKLYTRDYYSISTYFRLFIPNMFKQYDKALYLDSDIVILDDIANLYNIDIGNNYVGAAPDDVIATEQIFRDYAEKVVGCSSYKTYFNAGILIMNLKEMRDNDFENKFLHLLDTVKYYVAQDQDYLNRFCKGRVTILSTDWDRMPVNPDKVNDRDTLKLVHFNLAFKPWHFDNIPYQEYFWEYANKTEYIDQINEIKNNFSEEDKIKGDESHKKLVAYAKLEIACVGDDRINK